MQLIDKQNDLSLALLDFFQKCFQSFLKLTTVFCTGNKRSHIKCKDFLVLKSIRHISSDNTLCQSLYGCRFTNTWLTDEYRIVLGFTGKNTDNMADLIVSADHRIKLSFPCSFHQVITILLEGIVGCLRIIARHTLITANL